MVKAGTLVGPRIFSTGMILYGAETDFKVVINNLDDAKSHLRRLKAVGAFSVKSYNQPRRDQRQQVIAAARELQMNVVPEGGSHFLHNMTMVMDGHTGVEHCLPIAPVYNDVVRLWKAGKTGYTPTLVVAYGGLSGEYYWYEKTDVWEKTRLLTYVPRSAVDARSIRRQKTPDKDYGHVGNAKVCKLFADAGIRVNMGAHGQLDGLAAHWEMWMFVQGGMTPLEAIRAATFNGAHYLGMDKDLGSIEPGKCADLIVLDKNPLENIQNTEFVRTVVVNGRVYDAETMNEIGTRERKRFQFYFANDIGGTIVGDERQGCICGVGN
jgi:imidazolonepropionase-like amidohydrolase